MPNSPDPAFERIWARLNASTSVAEHRFLTGLVLAIQRESTDDGPAVDAGAAPAHPTRPARRDERYPYEPVVDESSS